jgi:hypothetical protein
VRVTGRLERVPSRWWDEDAGEIFWLEITDRDDLGTDLHAPGRV